MGVNTAILWLKSNQIDLEDNNLDVLRYYDNGYFHNFAYCEFFPGNNWTKKSFDDSGWKRGMSGFSGIKLEGSTTRSQGTVWTSDRLWLRKTFHIKRCPKTIFYVWHMMVLPKYI